MKLELHLVFPPVLAIKLETVSPGQLVEIQLQLKHLMATVAQLENSLSTLEEAVAQERTEIADKMAAQQAQIDILQAEIETGENPRLDGAVARLATLTAEVQGIVTPTPPQA